MLASFATRPASAGSREGIGLNPFWDGVTTGVAADRDLLLRRDDCPAGRSFGGESLSGRLVGGAFTFIPVHWQSPRNSVTMRPHWPEGSIVRNAVAIFPRSSVVGSTARKMLS